MFRSLKSKLIISLCGIALFSMVVTSIVSSILLMRSHRDSIRSQLQATGASLMSLGISDFSELKDFQEFNAFIENALQMERVNKIIRIFDKDRRIIFTTVGSSHDRLPVELKEKITKPAFILLKGDRETYESLVLPYKAHGRLYYLQIVIPLPHYEEILSSFKIPGFISFIVLLVISSGFSLALASRLIRPVQKIADHLLTLDPVEVEKWRIITDPPRGQYLDPITQGINRLIRRTQVAIFRLKKMARYLAHELRTPLTVIQGEAETILMRGKATDREYASVIKSSLEEVQRMSGSIATILLVAEDRQTLPKANFQKVLLHDWLEENLPHWEKVLKRPISLLLPNDKKFAVVTDPELLFHMVDNLIRNIRDHTSPGGPVFMELEEKDGVILGVRDSGKGMPESLLRSLNDPDEEPLTDGVGLHLCRRAALIADIRLRFFNLSEGGLKVSLTFQKEPAAKASDSVY